ncbi:hypothetical protein NBZ79_04565 [Sneathiella marina]|uniref:DUF3311 domain-containing protein n=1 Tax=Sneathiella marina TaxID=2950108 RepID=A0ABY4W5Z5_9PROT|nr:hypothetical protein [Sneathiella marina]USG62249.1 hypothetical protein NBZ79_04565 [Sneathiella marina]
MIRTGRKKEWSILLFVACLIIFMPPVLSIFDESDLVFGIPMSFLYLFGSWAGVILFTAIGARRRTLMKNAPEQPGFEDLRPGSSQEKP